MNKTLKKRRRFAHTLKIRKYKTIDYNQTSFKKVQTHLYLILLLVLTLKIEVAKDPEIWSLITFKVIPILDYLLELGIKSFAGSEARVYQVSLPNDHDPTAIISIVAVTLYLVGAFSIWFYRSVKNRLELFLPEYLVFSAFVGIDTLEMISEIFRDNEKVLRMAVRTTSLIEDILKSLLYRLYKTSSVIILLGVLIISLSNHVIFHVGLFLPYILAISHSHAIVRFFLYILVVFHGLLGYILQELIMFFPPFFPEEYQMFVKQLLYKHLRSNECLPVILDYYFVLFNFFFPVFVFIKLVILLIKYLKR